MSKANNVKKKHKASATNDENKEKPDAELAAQSTAQKAKVSVERLRNGRRGVFTKSQKPRSVHGLYKSDSVPNSSNASVSPNTHEGASAIAADYVTQPLFSSRLDISPTLIHGNPYMTPTIIRRNEEKNRRRSLSLSSSVSIRMTKFNSISSAALWIADEKRDLKKQWNNRDYKTLFENYGQAYFSKQFITKDGKFQLPYQSLQEIIDQITDDAPSFHKILMQRCSDERTDASDDYDERARNRSWVLAVLAMRLVARHATLLPFMIGLHLGPLRSGVDTFFAGLLMDFADVMEKAAPILDYRAQQARFWWPRYVFGYDNVHVSGLIGPDGKKHFKVYTQICATQARQPKWLPNKVIDDLHKGDPRSFVDFARRNPEYFKPQYNRTDIERIFQTVKFSGLVFDRFKNDNEYFVQFLEDMYSIMKHIVSDYINDWNDDSEPKPNFSDFFGTTSAPKWSAPSRTEFENFEILDANPDEGSGCRRVLRYITNLSMGSTLNAACADRGIGDCVSNDKHWRELRDLFRSGLVPVHADGHAVNVAEGACVIENENSSEIIGNTEFVHLSPCVSKLHLLMNFQCESYLPFANDDGNCTVEKIARCCNLPKVARLNSEKTIQNYNDVRDAIEIHQRFIILSWLLKHKNENNNCVPDYKNLLQEVVNKLIDGGEVTVSNPDVVLIMALIGQSLLISMRGNQNEFVERVQEYILFYVFAGKSDKHAIYCSLLLDDLVKKHFLFSEYAKDLYVANCTINLFGHKGAGLGADDLQEYSNRLLHDVRQNPSVSEQKLLRYSAAQGLIRLIRDLFEPDHSKFQRKINKYQLLHQLLGSNLGQECQKWDKTVLGVTNNLLLDCKQSIADAVGNNRKKGLFDRMKKRYENTARWNSYVNRAPDSD